MMYGILVAILMVLSFLVGMMTANVHLQKKIGAGMNWALIQMLSSVHDKLRDSGHVVYLSATIEDRNGEKRMFYPYGYISWNASSGSLFGLRFKDQHGKAEFIPAEELLKRLQDWEQTKKSAAVIEELREAVQAKKDGWAAVEETPPEKEEEDYW